mgnify:CR=1 FL=1
MKTQDKTIDMEYQQAKKNNKKSENEMMTIRKKITSDRDIPVGKKFILMQ